MRRLLGLLLLVAAPTLAQTGPFMRVVVEPIPDSAQLPTCDAGNAFAWFYSASTGALYRCDSGQYIAPVAAAVPTGAIIMWSGTLASIPAGWALCDGTNGTPDLRDRFIKGAAAGQNPGATGGSATHGHTYTDELQHTHAVNVNDPGHTHVETNNSATTGGLAGWAARDTSTNTQVATGYSTASGTTGVTATTDNPAGSVATGNTQTASSEPPWFALAYIMKQ